MNRMTLESQGYRLESKEGQNVILENDEGGYEIWTEATSKASFVFVIDNIDYEFARIMT